MAEAAWPAAFDLARVDGDRAPPARVDVVVVGGGIVGASAALFLAEAGHSVALIEKGWIGAEQSGRNWGWCRFTLRDPAELELMGVAQRLWRDRASLGGADTGFRTTGIMYLIGRRPDDVAVYEAWLADARQHGLASRLIGRDEVARLLPNAGRRWQGALFTPEDGGAEPERAAPEIALAARRAGAAVLTGCAVRGVERTAGRVSAVITERGAIGCDAVLVAAGAWSRLFLGNLGIDLPQLKVLASVGRTAPHNATPTVSVAGTGWGFRRRDDGGWIVSEINATTADIVPDSFRLLWDYRRHLLSPDRPRLRFGRRFFEELRTARRWRKDEVSPFERSRVLDPAPDRRVVNAAGKAIGVDLPEFSGIDLTGSWAGYIDVTPDALPVISGIAGWPGLFVATGFSGHGFGIGPGGGRLAADLVAGLAPSADPAPFRADRFPRLARTSKGRT
ncbi:Glycine/D-amino acid oxidase, deaminating [uncultured Pleomorphomonas sp.]|uniref:Glycine/D-amino acid oxidase, deaminating n=1 Tax=uncultured Pleomorphomonas sp. TaxID=442121 RepID=A0A212LFQ3_9HYPH|nr:FAD-binding oxidoreductase [uncultured Pleomorphomonas sp.]SCM76392.1 Glycine/D-amino acid oxidase, deaminating [uncultured Pleomorphomonas sp.]